MGCRRFHQLSGLLRTVTGLDTSSKSGSLGPSLGGSVAGGSRGTFDRWLGRVKARIPLFARANLPGRKGPTQSSSLPYDGKSRSSATVSSAMAIAVAGRCPSGNTMDEREWYRDEPPIDRIGKAIPRSRTAQPVKKRQARATPPGSKHSGPHVHIQRVRFLPPFRYR